MARPPFDLSLYLVTDTALCGERGVVATAVAATKGGATMVQLRDPHARTRVLVDMARALVHALAPYGVPLIVNDRIDVALAAGAAGAHIGQSDMTPADARRLLGPDAILGLSIGTQGQLARSDLDGVDYVGIGSFRATATKADTGQAIGIDGVRDMAACFRVPTVAIGGIKVEHVGELIRAGVDGVAVVSAMCAVDDPAREAARFAAALKQARG